MQNSFIHTIIHTIFETVNTLYDDFRIEQSVGVRNNWYGFLVAPYSRLYSDSRTLDFGDNGDSIYIYTRKRNWRVADRTRYVCLVAQHEVQRVKSRLLYSLRPDALHSGSQGKLRQP